MEKAGIYAEVTESGRLNDSMAKQRAENPTIPV
jgi:hypothetical protein